MTDKERKYYQKKYRHLNLYFRHGPGWDHLTLAAARELDGLWPNWMPNWLKRLNNKLLYAYGGKSIVKITKFYWSPLRKLIPFIKSYPRFTQIKEKFGSLCLYGCGKIGSIMEKQSHITCENCGSTKNVGSRGGSWIKTLCKDCIKEGDQWKPIGMKQEGHRTIVYEITDSEILQ